MDLDIRKIASIVGGRISPSGSQGTITGISTDSRTIQAGELFVPLRGANFDGHDFLIRAYRRGAAACLSEEIVAGFPIPVIQVEDTLVALGDLAAAIRRNFTAPVVAVTGSAGKTTTKEMLSSILAQTGPGLKTEGNFNNLIGLPLTLFRWRPEHNWAVLEMGMSRRGEIARLAEIAAPQVGIITNIGPAHLEGLGSIDGVARAKGELFAALSVGGVAIINADDERVVQLPVANGVRRLLFGLKRPADVTASDVKSGVDSLSMRIQLPTGQWNVSMKVGGRQNVLNALAAAAAAVALHVPGELIVRGLEQFQPYRGRLEVFKLDEGIVLIDDTYNANPLSMQASLQYLAETAGTGRRIAVLGDMLELGEDAADWHHKVGAAAAIYSDLLLVMGGQAEATAAGASAAGMAADKVVVLSSHQAVVENLMSRLQPNDRILVKGSRGMQMEKICQEIREAHRACLCAGNH